MLSAKGGNQLIVAVVSLCISVMLGVNAFFISRLVTEIDNNGAALRAVQIQVAKLEQAMHNKGYLEEAIYSLGSAKCLTGCFGF